MARSKKEVTLSAASPSPGAAPRDLACKEENNKKREHINNDNNDF